MAKIKILVIPNNNDLVMSVEDEFLEKIVYIISNIKKNKNKLAILDIPEIGLCGLLLTNDNSIRVYTNGHNILYSRDNITEILTDKRKRISTLILNKINKLFYKELSYYFEVYKVHKKNTSVFL